MSVLTVQNDFTHGEFSPKLIARFDISLYNKGASKLRNVMIINQGGATRRAGTVFVHDFLGTLATNDFRMVEFQLTEDIFYLFIFTEAKLEIFRDSVLVATIATTFIQSQIRDLKMAQTDNLMLITHPDFESQQIANTDPTGSPDISWSLEIVDFTLVPTHDFEHNYDDSTFRVNTSGPNPLTIEVLTGTFNFLGSQNVNYDGGVFISEGSTITEPIGFARILSIDVGGVFANIDIISPFSSKVMGGGITGKDVVIGEAAWSNNTSPIKSRGWPTTVTFYQDRLWFGGSKSLPQTVFASKIGDFLDFEIGTGLPDDAIIEELATDSLNKIKHIIADRTLQLFTTTSEFALQQFVTDVVAPGTVSVTKQTGKGASDVEPILLDNSTFYVKRGGRALMVFNFDDNVKAYQSFDISILSPQLIRNPIASAVLQSTTRDDSDFLFLMNEDGTMAIYQTRQDQNISAFTLAETGPTNVLSLNDGFKGGVQVGDDLFLMVKRTIEGTEHYFIERFDFDAFTDSATIKDLSAAPTAVITGLGYLEGETVRVRGEITKGAGFFVFASQVVAGSEITVKDERGNDQVLETVEIGLNFNPLIEPLPVVIQAQDGTTAYIPKRNVRIFVDYFDSLGIFIQDVLIPHREFGPLVLDQPPIPATGVEEFRDLGWSRRPPVTITQTDPLPMTILAIGYEVAI